MAKKKPANKKVSQNSELKKFSAQIIRHVDIKADETQRHFDVVAEQMDKKIDLLAEGQIGLGNQISENHKEFQEFRGEVNYKFNVVFDELHLIRTDLTNKADKDDLIALEKRVLALEKRSSSKK